MKKILLNFADSLISRDQMKSVKGGCGESDSSCTSKICYNPSIPQDSGNCISCGSNSGDCKITYQIGGSSFSYNIASTSCIS